MSSWDTTITGLEVVVQDARNHQKEMEKLGIEQGVRNAQEKIDKTLDELHYAQLQARPWGNR
ncbi:hypothetical protein AB0G76_36875 [Streptomyces asoensis]|uniref:hypothetical protein n=1 Tax=Streptomyces asoensis TaxID=249586 RepID=UPI0033C031C9